MDEDLTERLAALERLPVPITWADVEAHPVDAHLDVVADRSPRRSGHVLAVAGVGVMVVLVAIGLIGRGDEGTEPVRTSPGPEQVTTTPPATTTAPVTTTAPTTTTAPVDFASWRAWAVEVWTGDRYVVWAGGSKDELRADGWMVDPVTGESTTIPPAPIGPRRFAGGVWTGTELIVCCGGNNLTPDVVDTATAAAFDPQTTTWRTLADPPEGATGLVVGAAWTGEHVLVLVTAEYAPTSVLLAYDPAEDAWTERSTPPSLDRLASTVWSGDEFYLVPDDGRVSRYDPSVDVWRELPTLPEDRRLPWYASSLWAGDQLVIWGNDRADDTAAIGYRWRPGDESWRPMASAPVDPVRWGEWTPGSQTLGYDDRTGRVIVVAMNRGDTGADRRDLLAYDPIADTWTPLGEVGGLGYQRVVTIADGRLLVPDREHPVAFSAPGGD